MFDFNVNHLPTLFLFEKNKQNSFLARSILYFTFKIGYFVSQNVINTFFIYSFLLCLVLHFEKALITQNAHNSSAARVCVISFSICVYMTRDDCRERSNSQYILK